MAIFNSHVLRVLLQQSKHDLLENPHDLFEVFSTSNLHENVGCFCHQKCPCKQRSFHINNYKALVSQVYKNPWEMVSIQSIEYWSSFLAQH